jgi:putative alpha-1,2-mannosidase
MFGLPLVENAKIKLPGGKTFEVLTRSKTGSRNKIEKASLNGKNIPIHSITHQQLMQGGQLILELE